MVRCAPLLLLYVLSSAGCESSRPQPVATEEQRRVADLIDQLASPDKPPQRHPELGPWMTDAAEHPQVASAKAKLVALGPTIFPELVKHLDDKRYSYSASYSVTVDHTVGESAKQVMEQVVCGRFDRYSYKSRTSPSGTSMQPSFGGYLHKEFDGAANYAARAASSTREQLEKDYVEWYLRQERSAGFVDAEQEREIVTPCLKRLAELKAEERDAVPSHVVLKTTPELVKLFGGKGNLSEVQNAWSSTYLDGLPVPIAMYAGGRYARMADMVGAAESYDFTKPVDGELNADLTAHFTGARYWQAKNAGRDENPVIVKFDMQRRILEVRVGDQAQGRASFEPAAARLEAFFTELGYKQKPR